MKTTRLKAMMLSLTVAAMLLLPTTSTAQSDGFFKNYDNGDRDGDIAITGGLTNQTFGQEAPLGSGLLIMLAAGAGYAILKKKED